jgi:hypothetical protein
VQAHGELTAELLEDMLCLDATAEVRAGAGVLAASAGLLRQTGDPDYESVPRFRHAK